MPDAFHFKGFRSPNYTQVPDELFDELLPDLTEAELKVLLYIIRRTFGFKRESDNISLSQMVNGIVTSDGRRLDRGAGLAKSGVAKALNGLLDKSIILRTRRASSTHGDQPTNYRLHIRSDSNGSPRPIRANSDGGSQHGHGVSTPVDRGVHRAHRGVTTGVDTQDTGYKKQSDTRVGVSQKGSTTTPHLELVSYFHAKAGHPATQPAAPKELKQAKDLLAEHGEETSRHIVDFALARARETNFRMRHFGAIFDYVPEAIAAFTQTAARRRRDDHARMKQRDDDARFAAYKTARAELLEDARFQRILADRLEAAGRRQGRELKPWDVGALREQLVREQLDHPNP